MEIKGKIKEISLDEKQAKVILQPQPDFPIGDDPVLADAYRRGLIMSSNQVVQMHTVRLIAEGGGEGKDIVADVFVNPGTGRWAGKTFYNINNIALDVPVIQREDELEEPDVPVQGTERPVELKTTVPVPPTIMPEPEFEEQDALQYTPESAQLEIGKKFLEIALLSKEFFKTFKK